MGRQDNVEATVPSDPLDSTPDSFLPETDLVIQALPARAFPISCDGKYVAVAGDWHFRDDFHKGTPFCIILSNEKQGDVRKLLG